MKQAPALIIVLLACATVGAAQGTDPKTSDLSEKSAPGSTVTGHVYLDDAKGPARKAQVYLEPAASLEIDSPPNQNSNTDRGPVTASVETRFDGSYSFTHVAPGSYYVIATCAGYISPFIQLLLAEDRSPNQNWAPLGPEQKQRKSRILRSLARVDVQSNLPATADVVLERGAAVSGNISYDDGPPATGLQVMALTPMDQNGKEIWTQLDFRYGFAGLMGRSTTDDRGNYRISGLPPGNYVVEADLQFSFTRRFIAATTSEESSSNPDDLPIYSGNTPHVKDAADFSLHPTEERMGEDIVLPISKLHTIRGNIVAARDGHIVNNGTIVLLNASDQTSVGTQSLTDGDQSFTFSFVFDGDYILRTDFPSDVDYVPLPQRSGYVGPPQFDVHLRYRYGSASIPIHVQGDMDGVTIAVPDLPRLPPV